MENLNFKGLMCPLPVINTKKHLEDKPETAGLSVTVDNAAASENIVRFLENHGFDVTVTTDNNDFIVAGQRVPGEANIIACNTDDTRKTVVLITSDQLGTGDTVLGEKLMISFLSTLSDLGDDLWRVIFLNAGVKLTAMPGEGLNHIMALADDGVSVLVCGTCLTHYDLLEDKQVGDTTNMMDVMSSLQLAEKVITL